MYFEVDENPNWLGSVSMRFKELGPARTIKQLRVSDRDSEGPLCWVTGWCDDAKQPLCPAYVQPVEESGLGLAYLIYGGNWGVRFKPVSLNEDWDLKNPDQWGEPFLLISDLRSVVYADEPPNH
ncbi:MAG: hypothetical protein AABY46_04840 [Nitrospirota bacterium]